MGQIYLAVNYIVGTDPDTWTGVVPSWRGAESSGHLQFVYDNGGPLQEMEVQSPPGIVFGNFRYPTFGRPHGGTDDNSSSDATSYISSADVTQDSTRYARDLIQLRPEQGPDKVWELLEQVHASFVKFGAGIDYDLNQNSNSYVTTVMNILGLDVNDLLISITPEDVERFPGIGVNLLEGAKTFGIFSTGETPITLFLSGTDGEDYIQSGIGVDVLSGFEGDDEILAGKAGDNISGGIGDDTLMGQEGADLIYDNGPRFNIDDDEEPSDEEKFAYDGEGNDELDGGEGSDILVYSGGTDVFIGGPGDDAYIVVPDAQTISGPNDNLTIRLFEDIADEETWFGHDTIVGAGFGIGTVVFEGISSDDVTINYNISETVQIDEVNAEFPTQFIHLLGVPSFNLGDYPVFTTQGSLEIIVDATGSSLWIENVSAAYIGGDNNINGNIYVQPSFSSPFGLIFDDIPSYQWSDVINEDGATVLVSDDLSENADAAATSFVEEREEDDANLPEYFELDGTETIDFLSGTDNSEIIEGREGDDVIDGNGGDDYIDGGEGEDQIDGGEGHDRVTYSNSTEGVTVSLSTGDGLGGEAEGDVLTNVEDLEGSAQSDSLTGDAEINFLFGLAGDDRLYGGGSGDQLEGGVGDDRLYGQDGPDVLFGGAGDDELYGGSGRDQLYGGDGNDHIESGFGSDLTFMDGGNGQDVLIARSGSAEMHGGDGNDSLYGAFGVHTEFIFGEDGDDFLQATQGNDQYDGGSGYDTLSTENMLSTIAPRYVHLEEGEMRPRYFSDTSIGIGTNTLISIEAYLGGLGEDQVFGTSGDNLLSGGRSDDELHGLAGNDTLYGGLNDDTLYGGDGDDALYGGSDNSSTSTGSDLIFGGAGTDITYYNDVFEAYTFSTQDGVLFVTHSGGDIDEIASDVEFITFTDSTNTWGELAAIQVNGEPIAGDDIVALTVGETITLDPRLNDSDPDGDPLNIVAINGSAFGPNSTTTIISPEIDLAISMTTGGGLGFEADDLLGLGLAPGETYVATVTYTVSDGLGGFADADITVTVTGAGMVANTAPIAVSDSLTVAEDQVSEIDVLANDTDPDGDPLAVTMVGGQAISVGNTVTLVSGAIVSLLPSGSLSYDTNGAFESLNSGQAVSEEFTYTVSDGQGGATVGALSVTIEGTEPPTYNDVFGTTGDDRNDDRILGTTGDDRIFDYDGRDEILGRAGADVFVMAFDGDRDEIMDFADGEDLIDITSWGVTDFSQLNITQDGAHVRVRYDLEGIEVKSFTATDFSAADFILADEPTDPVDPPDPTYNDVFGTTGDDRNDDRILGTTGDDRIFDYDGRDEILGRAGADVFVMAFDGDRDEIMDFADGEDLIDITSWGVTDFSQLNITQDGAHVRVRYDLEDIEVKSFTATDFSAADFILADEPTDPVDPPDPTYNDVFGTTGDDRNDDRILGTTGDDRIFDYDGRDEILGRAGADVFVMAFDGDRDEIMDFADGEDLIDITSWGVTDFSQLNITQDGAHVRVRYDLEDIEVKSFTATDFSAADFILA